MAHERGWKVLKVTEGFGTDQRNNVFPTSTFLVEFQEFDEEKSFTLPDDRVEELEDTITKWLEFRRSIA